MPGLYRVPVYWSELGEGIAPQRAKSAAKGRALNLQEQTEVRRETRTHPHCLLSDTSESKNALKSGSCEPQVIIF